MRPSLSLRRIQISASRRRGNITVLSAFVLVMLLGLIAFAIDLGHVYVVEAELQRAADCSSLAAVAELANKDALNGDDDPALNVQRAKAMAVKYVAENAIAGESAVITDDDVDVGYLADPNDPDAQMTFDDPAQFNAVTVRVPKKTGRNGEIPLIFARVLGIDSIGAEASATAVILRDIKGFQTPNSGTEVPILPFALDQETWDALNAGGGSDDFSWNSDLGQAGSGSDGILEVNLYPQDTGMPGNRGTVKIGDGTGGTSTIERQITNGVSDEDLTHHGGKIELNDQMELFLDGDPGISAGFKNELANIIGEPRIIPIFSEVNGGGGATSVFTIVKWVGVRIVEVEMTGSNKRVLAQPAEVFVDGAIANPSGEGASQFVYSPLWLAR